MPMSGRYMAFRSLVFMMSAASTMGLAMVGTKTEIKQHISAQRSQIAPDGSIVFGAVSNNVEASKPPVNINFGGSKHGQSSREGQFSFDKKNKKYGEMQLDRPEMVKSEVCSPIACRDCGSRKGCWHGAKRASLHKGNYDGYLQVIVAPNTQAASYIAEVWARCGEGGGRWTINFRETRNAILDFFVGGKLKETRKIIDNNHGFRSPRVEISNIGDTRIRISLRPITTAKWARAMLLVSANGILPSVEDCMSVKDGLAVFGDGSDASLELRNVNQRQLTCLQGGFDGLSSPLAQKCIEWMELLSTDQKKTLKDFLSAALVKKGSSMVAVQNRNSLPGCVDPAVDDPESWECECMPEMLETCSLPKNSKLSLESCLRTIMCNKPAICGGWKDQHCEDSMVDVSATGALDARKKKKKSLGGAAAGLDGSMKGKCGSNEV